MSSRIHICHVVYRLDFGGLEKLLIDMINRLPHDEFTHSIVSLTKTSRIVEQIEYDIGVYSLNKRPGQDVRLFPRIYRLLKELKPDVVHTYNLAALEMQSVAFFAGIKLRIHAEHGRDSSDPMGLKKKHRLLRKALDPFVSQYVAVSEDIGTWLKQYIGIRPSKVSVIRNGIDTNAFYPNFKPSPKAISFLNIARLNPIKNHSLILRSFRSLLADYPNITLTIAGDGPERSSLESLIKELGVEDKVTLLGEVSNVIQLYHEHQVFLLSSIAEGTPMTILEAMSCGLPVVATRVGGVTSLVREDLSGYLVESDNCKDFSEKMRKYLQSPQRILAHGEAGRSIAMKELSASTSDSRYIALYRGNCSRLM